MSYNEKADLDQHWTDVNGLREIARGLGSPVSNFALGLDIGGGLGLHAPWLQEMAEKVYVTDIVDYTTVYDGKLVYLNREKFVRNSVAFDAAKTEYHKVDAQALIYKDGLFDFVFSVNAFEHIPDPIKAMHEVIRVTRPGALVMMQFDPLWHSAYGHHLWNLNFEPWAHLILSAEEMYQAIRDRGGNDQSIHIYDHETNRVAASTFRSFFEEQAGQYFKRSYFNYWAKSAAEDDNAQHPNFAKCLAHGYPAEELLIRGMQFVGIRS
jgi:ubiquinone/menaquinone biosynthesis C-methylase UbiE